MLRRDRRPHRPGGAGGRRPVASRDWMAERFDQSRLATEREKIMARGRAQTTGATAPRHEGLRGHGPAPEPDRGVAHAQRVERLGYDGLHVAETVHDSMAVALLVAEHTERITVRTSVDPGLHPQPDPPRLRGLGPRQAQRRSFRARPRDPDPPEHRGPLRRALRRGPGRPAAGTTSVPCGPPSRRSPRAQAPAYESAHYRVTRLQPYFNPGPDARPAAPPIYLGGVQRKACALAGAVADGFVSHPTNSNPALPARDLPARPGRGRPRRRGRDLRRRVRDRHRDIGDHRGLTDAVLRRTGAPAPAAGLLVLDARLRADPRALRLGRARTPPARADPRTTAGTTWPSVLSDEVLDTLVPCGTFDELPALLRDRFSRAGPGHRGVAPARPAATTRPSAPSWPSLQSGLTARRLSAAWGRSAPRPPWPRSAAWRSSSLIGA